MQNFTSPNAPPPDSANAGEKTTSLGVALSGLVPGDNRSGGFLPAWPLPPVAPCSLPDCPQTDAIALVDLDGDGLLDLVEANYGDPSIWRRNRGHVRGFERPTSLPGSASTYTQALAFGSFSERTEESVRKRE